MITFVATPALTVPDAVTFPLITKISWTLSASTTTLPAAVTFAPLAMRAIALSPTFSTVMVPATDTLPLAPPPTAINFSIFSSLIP